MAHSRISRREAMKRTGLSLSTGASVLSSTSVLGLSNQAVAQSRPENNSAINVLHPRNRVPLSFIIDDSTCLVNMGHFCMPQFANAWPERETYKQPWRDWPREIPDRFVREFGEWCAEHGVKGKYSIVPYPACVGWLDRSLPGWSQSDLQQSLKLVRELMMPNWDIHPEMITHTRVIDLKTGRPMQEVNAGTMENSFPQTDISTDQLTEYLAYSLRILQNCGLHCEGITTPGGFGNRVKDKLPVAVNQAVRDVFGSELPHYFKYVHAGDQSTTPLLEYGTRRELSDLTINVPAGTGDWFGGWEGTKTPQPDRYCTQDATSGRMVDLIQRNQPAVMLCHWPGMYCNGTKVGFLAFKRIVESLDHRFRDQTQWMKISEIGRYEAAKHLTKISQEGNQGIRINSPIACKDFTFSVHQPTAPQSMTLHNKNDQSQLKRVNSPPELVENTFMHQQGKTIICLNAPRGSSLLKLLTS